MKIPEEFYKAKRHPIVRTVKQLKAQLQKLPDSLRITGDFGRPQEMVVYNHGDDTEHLALREVD